MRELKFRVWNKEAGEYLEGEEAKDFVLKLDGTHYVEMTFGYYDKGKNWVIEQYTGLKDKNGEKIYEGDIVRDDKGEKCFVKWTEIEAHFGLYVGKGMELTDFIWMRGEDLEVIGNIHENPELVKEEK